MSSSLADRFCTTELPGKPAIDFSFENYSLCFIWGYPVAVLPSYFVDAEGKCTYVIPQALHSLIHDSQQLFRSLSKWARITHPSVEYVSSKFQRGPLGIVSLFQLFHNLHFIFSSVQFSHSVVSDSLQPHGLQHARLPCPSPTPGACSNSCPLSQ